VSVLALLRGLRELAHPAATVLERTKLPNDQGEVVTVAFADHRSPSGLRYRTAASWPDGMVAERRWAQHEVDARAGHAAMAARQRHRFREDAL
jgi:hypothetical protein